MNEIIERLDNIIRLIDTLMKTNDWFVQILCTIISSLAVILSVVLGTKSIKSKYNEKKLELIDSSDFNFDKTLWTVITNIEDLIYQQLNYNIVKKFYNDYIKNLLIESASTSTIRNTGTYIIERYTYNIFTFRIKEKSTNTVSNGYHKVDMIDSDFFVHLKNMLMYINFASKKFTVCDRKNKLLDPLQKKLGGPNINYSYTNILKNQNTVNYDSRFYIYYDLFKIINYGDDSSIKAYSYILNDKIIILTSKYLLENKIYSPLIFEDSNTGLPKFYLSSVCILVNAVDGEEYVRLRYLSTKENIHCSTYYVQKINSKSLSKLDKLDQKFEKEVQCLGVNENDTIIELRIKTLYLKNFFIRNQKEINHKFKNIHSMA